MGNPVKRSVQIFGVERNVTSQSESFGSAGLQEDRTAAKIPEEEAGGPHTDQFVGPVPSFLGTFHRKKGIKYPFQCTENFVCSLQLLILCCSFPWCHVAKVGSTCPGKGTEVRCARTATSSVASPGLGFHMLK